MTVDIHSDQTSSNLHKSQLLHSSNHRLKSSGPRVLNRTKTSAFAPNPNSIMSDSAQITHKGPSNTVDLRRCRSSKQGMKHHHHHHHHHHNQVHNHNSITIYGKNPECGEAIRSVAALELGLGLQNFKPLKKLGYGDIACVYLVELKGTHESKCLFAMKMMDKELLENRKKVDRVHTERDILRTLDHPFLPTLYADFETDRFGCVVMEFCSGGDLHTLRQKQPFRHFSESASRFYAAEVLLALEYLHMKGVIYRDLKPENILIREDGHIMLSDFDLSLQCTVKPTLVKSCSINFARASKAAEDADRHARGTPVAIEADGVVEADAGGRESDPQDCMQPSCLFPRGLRRAATMRAGHQVTPWPEVLVEPIGTQSMSFVGTYEYIAPEVIAGEGHGSAVDWWAFGILLYELLYGTTPFKGQDNKATLYNIMGKPLEFPEIDNSGSAARSLIRGLLAKDPEERLGYARGATEIRQHHFFRGINWALIRSMSPPEIPMPFQMAPDVSLAHKIETSDFGF